MIDRLQQVRMMSGVMGNSTSEQLFDPNLQQPQQQQAQDEFDEVFIQDIKTVRSMIAALNSNNKKMQQIKNQYAKAIKHAHQKESSAEMNEILLANADYQQKIKNKLIQIDHSVKDAEKNKPNQPQTRMKKNFYLNLSQEVSDALQKQQSFEEQFKNTVKEKVTRQVRLIDRNIAQDELEQYINHPQLAQQMLQKKIYGQPTMTLKNTVIDIQDKFNDIKKLQASVTQCVALFNELSTLIFAQGQKIDSIEANVLKTGDYIKGAQKKLVKAKEHQKCGQKCMCVAIIIGLVILVIVVIVVVASK